MAWGARVEDGKWRLCFRKGKTITEAMVRDTKTEIVFKNQKVAKACADALNETYWPLFEKAQKGKAYLPAQTRIEMVNLILSFM